MDSTPQGVLSAKCESGVYLVTVTICNYIPVVLVLKVWLHYVSTRPTRRRHVQHYLGCNGVKRGGGLRCITSYGGVQLYRCVCGIRKGGSDSRTQPVAEWILARTKPLHR
jgi:hypothetical protein